MPDLTEEQLHESFARFRAAVQDDIRPPGTHAVRRRVARRRRTRAAIAVCGVILAVVGLYTSYDRHEQHSAASFDALNALHQAMEQVGITPGSLAVSRPGVWFGTVRGAPAGHTFGYEYPAHPGGGGRYPAGTYMLDFACVGPGIVTVTYRDQNDDGSIRALCNGMSGTSLYLSTPDVITVGITGDADAVATGTQFAIALTDPRAVEAQAALPDGLDGAYVADSTGSTYDPRIDSREVTVAGTYRLSLACVGSGSIQATLILGSVVTTGPVTCDWNGSHVDLDVTGAVPANLSVQLGGTADAGFAYRVVRISP